MRIPRSLDPPLVPSRMSQEKVSISNTLKDLHSFSSARVCDLNLPFFLKFLP